MKIALNLEIVRQQRDTILKKDLIECNEGDIFNIYATDSFYKLLLERPLAFKDETFSGAKQAKIRLSVLLATDISETSAHHQNF